MGNTGNRKDAVYGGNICPRCGSANSAVAKFCFQCGIPLKAVEKPIVCGKCKTANAANSTYCKSCGALLAEGAGSKICPRCNSYVSSGATICSTCGYSFAGATEIMPVPNPAGVMLKPPKRSKPVPVGARKARVGGLIRMLLALIVAYILIMPVFMKLGFLDFGIFRPAQSGAFSGADIITDIFMGLSGQGAAYLAGLSFNRYIIYILFIVVLITLLIELLSGLARLFSGRLTKKRKGFVLFLFILSLFATAYLLLNQYSAAIAASLQDGIIKNMFVSWAATSDTVLAPNYYLICGYLLAVYILSVIFSKPKTIG